MFFFFVELRCSVPFDDTDDMYLCPKTTYYFRCDVSLCSRLIWEISGNPILTILTHTKPSDVITQDPVNVFIQKISLGESEKENNFTSYLWFNSSYFEDEDSVDVTCKSFENNKTMTIRYPGK